MDTSWIKSWNGAILPSTDFPVKPNTVAFWKDLRHYDIDCCHVQHESRRYLRLGMLQYGPDLLPAFLHRTERTKFADWKQGYDLETMKPRFFVPSLGPEVSRQVGSTSCSFLLPAIFSRQYRLCNADSCSISSLPIASAMMVAFNVNKHVLELSDFDTEEAHLVWVEVCST